MAESFVHLKEARPRKLLLSSGVAKSHLFVSTTTIENNQVWCFVRLDQALPIPLRIERIDDRFNVMVAGRFGQCRRKLSQVSIAVSERWLG